MKKIVPFLLFICFSAFSIANPTGEKKEENSSVESFKILVIDAETEEPIPAAKVKINQSNTEAYTDFDGFTDFSNLIVGSYDIEISFVSYQKKTFEAFQIDKSNNQLVVKLNP